MNCGACGTQCSSVLASNAVCRDGGCACPTGWSVCDATLSLPRRCADLASSVVDCGTCGNACASNATCVGGSCQCPVGQAVCGGVCAVKPSGATCQGAVWSCPAGPSPGCAGSCCGGGQTCCPTGGCPKPHPNGLGGTYYDCNDPYAPSATTQAAAMAAADSWASGTTYASICSPSCLARQTANACAVWCWAGSISGYAGRVSAGNTISCTSLCGAFNDGSAATWQ